MNIGVGGSELLQIAVYNHFNVYLKNLPMSFENLFIIRPMGLVSKNKTGAFKTASTMWSWSFCDEFSTDEKKSAARKMDSSKAVPTSPPYT